MNQEQTQPTKVMMWRAVRVTQPKVPQTLADIPEGVRCVARRSGETHQMVKVRQGQYGVSTAGHYPENAHDLIVMQILDPQPEEKPVPKTFGELRDGQCFRQIGDTYLHWRHQNWRVTLEESGACSTGGITACMPIHFIPDIEMVLEEQPQ